MTDHSHLIFERHSKQYDEWFDRNQDAYQSELNALRKLLPPIERGLEVGVGSGRFAVPLGFEYGVEPSIEMCKLARERGNVTVSGVGESLPFKDSVFDGVLLVTTVCFIDRLDRALEEVGRVLGEGGAVLVGLIDKDSPVGREYLERKDESIFYSSANFYSVPEMVEMLRSAGFSNFNYTQTIFGDIGHLNEIHPVSDGWGEGSFVVIKAFV